MTPSPRRAKASLAQLAAHTADQLLAPIALICATRWGTDCESNNLVHGGSGMGRRCPAGHIAERAENQNKKELGGFADSSRPAGSQLSLFHGAGGNWSGDSTGSSVSVRPGVVIARTSD